MNDANWVEQVDTIINSIKLQARHEALSDVYGLCVINDEQAVAEVIKDWITRVEQQMAKG